MSNTQIAMIEARTGCDFDRCSNGAAWFVLNTTEYSTSYACIPLDAPADSLPAHEVRLRGLKARFADADQA